MNTITSGVVYNAREVKSRIGIYRECNIWFDPKKRSIQHVKIGTKIFEIKKTDIFDIIAQSWGFKDQKDVRQRQKAIDKKYKGKLTTPEQFKKMWAELSKLPLELTGTDIENATFQLIERHYNKS